MMAVHSRTGSALSLGKLSLALGKGHAAYAATSILLAFSRGALLLVAMTDFETSDKKKSKAGQT